MLRITTCHSAEGAKKYFDVSLKTSDYYTMPVRAFSQANEAQFYVSMSRARSAMHVFTDSKVALRDAVSRPSKRPSFWELVDGAEKDRALKAELDRQRAKAQEEQQERNYER